MTNTPRGAAIDALAERLAVIADMAAERGIEKACSRIVQLTARKGADPGVADKLRGRPKNQALQLITPLDIDRLGTNLPDLLAGTWDTFTARATVAVSSALAGDNRLSPAEVGWLSLEIVEALASHCQDTLAAGHGRPIYAGSIINPRGLADVLDQHWPR